MRGTIGVESKPGVGSTFWFELPLPVSHEPSSSVAAAPPETESEVVLAHFGEPPVLVAEDNPVNQVVAARMVHKCGFHVEIAENGREAARLVSEKRYSAVLMDCQMPVLDGYAATGEIRSGEAQGTHLPIIAMTAHSLDGDREKCLAAGMDDYLAKPLQLTTLKSTLEHWTPPHREAVASAG
jgi:CheY-like chemotaxis protein